jgi:branched-subunit amino acid aminotransferase/4-amino-4-deoxychorismate lyase
LKERFNIDVIERKIKPEEIKDFDEAFFTGTAAEVTII